MDDISIKHADEKDINDVLMVERLAFGGEEEAHLVKILLSDQTAAPVVSLLAFTKEKAVGHILFTKVRINKSRYPLAYILAPMAVIPDFQNKGIGGLLIQEGLKQLAAMNVELVFVLGHIHYYPKNGFIADAAKFGFFAPHPIPKKVKEAWMVQELKHNSIKKYSGTVICADTLMHEKYWLE